MAQAQNEPGCRSLQNMQALEKVHEGTTQHHQEQMQQLRAAHEAEAEAMQSRNASEMDMALSRQKTVLAEQHQRALDTLASAHAAAVAEKETVISQLTTQFEKAGEEFRRQREELCQAVERAKEEGKGELSRWVGTYTAQLDDLETKSQEEKTAALAELEERLHQSHQEGMVALKDAHAAALKEEAERTSFLSLAH